LYETDFAANPTSAEPRPAPALRGGGLEAESVDAMGLQTRSFFAGRFVWDEERGV